MESDPRIRREIDWLAADGWSVDTLGMGLHPAPAVQNHYELAELASWVRNRLGAVIVYGLLPGRYQFRLLFEKRVPRKLIDRIRGGEYDLIVFNEFEFLPWIVDKRTFTAQTKRAHLHLDLHEYREPGRELDSLWKRLVNRYYKWNHRLIGHDAFDSRSTVASRIAALYERDFSIVPPVVVRNIPPFVDQVPSPVDDTRIELVFHGLASRGRGLLELLAAMRQLDARFVLTLMLVPNGTVIPEIQASIGDDLKDRVRIIPPVPMRGLARELQKYDLEVLFYPPISTNVALALPNKLFEAVQGRLGLVIGESQMMRQVVDEWGNGVIVSGWSGSDLAAELSRLGTAEISRLKAASDQAAHHLSAEAEGAAFLTALRGGEAA